MRMSVINCQNAEATKNEGWFSVNQEEAEKRRRKQEKRIDKLLETTSVKKSYPDKNTIWHESEHEMIRRDEKETQKRMWEEAGMTKEEVEESWKEAENSNAMLPIPHRITDK